MSPENHRSITTQELIIIDSFSENCPAKKLIYEGKPGEDELNDDKIVDRTAFIILIDEKNPELVNPFLNTFNRLKQPNPTSQDKINFWNIWNSYDPDLQPMGKYFLNEIQSYPDFPTFFIKRLSHQAKINFIYRSMP